MSKRKFKWHSWNFDGDELLFGCYLHGWYAWELKNVIPLAEPIPFKGKQGLWNVPFDTEQQINQQLKGATTK